MHALPLYFVFSLFHFESGLSRNRNSSVTVHIWRKTCKMPHVTPGPVLQGEKGAGQCPGLWVLFFFRQQNFIIKKARFMGRGCIKSQIPKNNWSWRDLWRSSALSFAQSRPSFKVSVFNINMVWDQLMHLHLCFVSTSWEYLFFLIV